MADQVENAESIGAVESILAATRNAGLAVQKSMGFYEQVSDVSAYQQRLLFALSDFHDRKGWAAEDSETGSWFVLEVRGALLAFSPAAVPVPGLNDDVVNIFLSVVIIFLPVALLSIYAARLVTRPLTMIAAAARAQSDADPAGAIFDETGPLEIRQLAKRLNEMRAQINSMLTDRTAMLRAVSYDLRTPFTRLKLRVERSVPPETAGVLLRDITAINEMIDETLSYLRSDSETEPARKTDLPSLLRTICSDFSDVGFAVTYAGPDRLPFICRSRALSRAVSNLVDNGTKHGDKVGINLVSLPDGTVRIEVSDDGPGIAESARAKMLEPFVKGDPSRGGFGLGLSIVREFVRRHGGRIELSPHEPNGLVAAIILPNTPQAPQSSLLQMWCP